MNEIIDLIQDYGQQCEDRDMNCYDTLEQIKSRLESLEKDAARYQWLRDVGDASWVPFCERTGYSAMQCDVAIDTAIQANKD